MADAREVRRRPIPAADGPDVLSTRIETGRRNGGDPVSAVRLSSGSASHAARERPVGVASPLDGANGLTSPEPVTPHIGLKL